MDNRRELDTMPFDKIFDTPNGRENCHATGYEELIDNEWWNEYVDADGELYYGR